jgi:cytidylate kinase
LHRGVHAIVERQIGRWNAERRADTKKAREAAVPRPVITVSRQLGSGGAEVASEVALRMNCEFIGYEIINEIANRNGICEELMKALDERTRTTQEKWIDSMIRKWNFDETDYYRHLIAAVRSIAEIGSVVILGRGACFIETSRPKINIRVIAPLENRIERVMKRVKCEREEARERIERRDLERKRFIKYLFDMDIDDPLHYDIVINTGEVSIVCAAALIERVWLHHITNLGKTDERQMTTRQLVY